MKLSTCDLFICVGGESDEWTEDYPDKGAEITVIGIFHTYEENGSKYIELGNAAME